MIKKEPSISLKRVVFSCIVISSLCSASFSQQQADFNKRDISIIHLMSLELLERYEQIINEIGESTISNPSLTNSLSEQFLELFINRQVMLYNDLDPGRNLSPFYESESYINNLLLWYPDGMVIDMDLNHILTGNVQSHGNEVYSVDFMATKKISGNYMNRQMNLNTENLLFRIAFHQDKKELRNFRIVGIRNVDSPLIPEYQRNLEEVNSPVLAESEAYSISEGIRTLLGDYSNYLQLLGSMAETEEDKKHYAESFLALFESSEVTVFNDLVTDPENYLVTADEYLRIFKESYPSGINNLSVTMDTVLFENIIAEDQDIYSTYISLNKFFSGAILNQEVFRNSFPLTVKVSFRRIGGTYEDFKIRSIDLEAENMFHAEIADEEPDQRIRPVTRKGFSLIPTGSIGQTRIVDHNLADLTLGTDQHTWHFSPGYGVTAGAGFMYSFGEHVALESGIYFNQYRNKWSAKQDSLQNDVLFTDLNGDNYYNMLNIDYDTSISVSFISIPLYFTWTSSKPGRFGVYASGGLVFSYCIGGEYQAEGESKYFGWYPDNPPVIEYLDIEELGFLERPSFREQGTLDGGGFNLSVGAAVGITIPVGYFTQIRVGPDIEWGITDFNKSAGDFKDILGNELEHRPTYLIKYGFRLSLVMKL